MYARKRSDSVIRGRTSSAFKNFKKANWAEITMKSTASFHECARQLQRMWQQVDESEKELYESEKNDDCPRGIAKTDAAWVECDLCDAWYHMDGENISLYIAEEMPFYHG